MLDRFKEAHAQLEGRSDIANERKIITFGSPHSLYLYYREAGGLLRAKDCVQSMFRYYTEMAGGCGRGFDDLLEAEYFLETGELERAELNAYRAAHKASTNHQISVRICAAFLIARVFAARGCFNEALDFMAELKDEVEQASGPILNSAYDVAFGYVGGIAGREDSFSRWLGEGDLAQSEILYQGMGFNYIAYGKHLLLKGDLIGLELLAEQMQPVFAPFSNMLGYLHAHILSAVARYRLYGMDRARAAMVSALAIGKADGIVLPIAEYGEHILDILEDMRQSGGTEEYLELLFQHTSRYVDHLRAFRGKKAEKPALTKREQEILSLVTEGRSNQEIASALFVAEVTVRKNITAIYRKLDVTGRAAAVRKALELKIL
jgi:LuxR family maltose regulon positive regulatory protein